MDYGAGAIMAVPAHDERDLAFAKAFGLPIVAVVAAERQKDDPCYTGEGISINSPAKGTSDFAITGLPTNEAKKKIIAALTDAARGQAAVNYKLRDWIFSRQRYWGEPFPLATHADGYSVPLEPPIVLPDMEASAP